MPDCVAVALPPTTGPPGSRAGHRPGCRGGTRSSHRARRGPRRRARTRAVEQLPVEGQAAFQRGHDDVDVVYPQPWHHRSLGGVGLGKVRPGFLVAGVAGRLGRRVDEVQHAGLEGLRRDQLQRDRAARPRRTAACRCARRSGARAGAVRPAAPRPATGGRRRPSHSCRCAPSPGSFFNAVTASTRSPWSCSELRHVNSSCWFDATILRASPSCLGEVGVLPAGGFTLGPGAGEAVVGLATEQHGVGRAEGGIHGSTHLVVEVREVPLVGCLDDAVERDEQACGDLPHDRLPVVADSVIH